MFLSWLTLGPELWGFTDVVAHVVSWVMCGLRHTSVELATALQVRSCVRWAEESGLYGGLLFLTLCFDVPLTYRIRRFNVQICYMYNYVHIYIYVYTLCMGLQRAPMPSFKVLRTIIYNCTHVTKTCIFIYIWKCIYTQLREGALSHTRGYKDPNLVSKSPKLGHEACYEIWET